ncbi:MAG TPA: J domain-containing protein [Stellaceae bacterium]|nr:J domain-containing protein [Stellaceae bacterium]
MNILETLDEATMQGAADVFRAYGVEISSTDPAELKKCRNRLMMQYHPDHTGNTKDAQRINAAYDILSGKQIPHPALPTNDLDRAERGGNMPNSEQRTSAWAYAGYPGGRRPDATISRTDYTDANFIKKSMWELSAKSHQEYGIWGYDGSFFRNTVSVYGSTKIFAYMATAMIELQTKGSHPFACRAVIVAEEGNRTFWLVYADGKYFDTPINLEHSQLNDNPSNDTMFTRALPALLDQIREQGAGKYQ